MTTLKKKYYKKCIRTVLFDLFKIENATSSSL